MGYINSQCTDDFTQRVLLEDFVSSTRFVSACSFLDEPSSGHFIFNTLHLICHGLMSVDPGSQLDGSSDTGGPHRMNGFVAFIMRR